VNFGIEVKGWGFKIPPTQRCTDFLDDIA